MLTKSEIDRRISLLRRINQNTEAFLKGFLRWSLTGKPPFTNSYLSWNDNISRYEWRILPSGYTNLKGKYFFYIDNSVFLSNGFNGINNTRSLIMKKQINTEQVLDEYTPKIQSWIDKHVLGEIAHFNSLMETSHVIDDSDKPSPLF